jgi:uncharacterized protein
VEPAFWDTSALVPLCVTRQSNQEIRELSRQYSFVVWWATPIEARSAFARDLRAGILTIAEHAVALERLAKLQRNWREIRPDDSLRSFAEEFVERYPLRAADALQLAAAYAWSVSRPFRHHLISGDRRLVEAAQAIGFRIIQLS